MTERQKIERKLDSIVREIVQIRDAGKPCITCGNKLPLTAGHFIKRRNLLTRWDLDNIHGQCWQCNSEDDFEKYREAMLRLYSYEQVASMVSMSKLNIKFTNYELTEMYDKLKLYKERIKNEKKE